MLQRALALHQKGQLADAETLYRKILRQTPKNADALHLLGVIEAQRRNSLAAIALFDRAIELNPKNAAFFCNRGVALKDLGRFDEALASYDRALAIKPDDAEALNNRGIVLTDLKRIDEALASFNRALAIRPDYAEALNNRGNALMDLKRLDQALANFNRAIAIRPDYAEALNNRGTALTDLMRLDEALVSFSRALAIKPDYAEALNNRGTALTGLKRLDEALASFSRALAIKPDYAEALYNRGSARLLCGDYRTGFADCEWRWATKEFSNKRPKIHAPNWRGEEIAGRRIVVFAEQGLGDTIQFSRYLPLLLERGAKVTFLCPAKLVRLLRCLSAEIEFVTSLSGQDAFDVQCALMSLPLWLGTDAESIPSGVPYLEPDAGLAGDWKHRIGGTGFKIGIAWQGNPDMNIARGRSFPLSEFAPLARRPNVRLISLQKTDGLDQMRNLPPGAAIETLGDGFDSGPDAFVDTAAVMSNLDLIVTCDTSIAHLAGALGQRTWVALKHVPDWRWLLDRDDCPWYPATRLFRQQTRGDWASAFRDMAVELDALLSDHAKP